MTHINGLRNLGNTCFLNAALQVVFGSRFLIHNVLLPHLDECQKGANVCAACAVAADFMLVSSNEADAPENVLQLLKKLMPHRAPGSQQDSHEFLLNLLNAINNALTGISAGMTKGKQVRYTKCSSCLACREKVETFWGIDVPIRDTMAKALSEYFGAEEMEEVYCEDCKETTSAVRSLKIETMPQILILQLGRFQFNMETNSSSRQRGVMAIPLQLNLREYSLAASPLSSPVTFECAGVVLHRGGSVNSGHYRAAAVDFEDGTWHLFDDSSVNFISWRKVQQSDEVYFALYERSLDKPTPLDGRPGTAKEDEPASSGWGEARLARLSATLSSPPRKVSECTAPLHRPEHPAGPASYTSPAPSPWAGCSPGRTPRLPPRPPSEGSGSGSAEGPRNKTLQRDSPRIFGEIESDTPSADSTTPQEGEIESDTPSAYSTTPQEGGRGARTWSRDSRIRTYKGAPLKMTTAPQPRSYSRGAPLKTSSPLETGAARAGTARWGSLSMSPLLQGEAARSSAYTTTLPPLEASFPRVSVGTWPSGTSSVDKLRRTFARSGAGSGAGSAASSPTRLAEAGDADIWTWSDRAQHVQPQVVSPPSLLFASSTTASTRSERVQHVQPHRALVSTPSLLTDSSIVATQPPLPLQPPTTPKWRSSPLATAASQRTTPDLPSPASQSSRWTTSPEEERLAWCQPDAGKSAKALTKYDTDSSEEERLPSSRFDSPPRRPFGCGLCGTSFATKAALLRHEVRHSLWLLPDSRPLACRQCQQTFGSLESLHRHARKHAEGSGSARLRCPLRCPRCGDEYPDALLLQRHLDAHGKPLFTEWREDPHNVSRRREHECRTCKQHFEDCKALYRHQKAFGERRLGKSCSACQRRCARRLRKLDQMTRVIPWQRLCDAVSY